MKVLIVAPRLPPYYSGTGTVAMEDAKALGARGVFVELACMSENGAKTDTVEGLTVHRLQTSLRLGNAGQIRGLESLPEWDLLHVHLPFIMGMRAVLRAARRRRGPVLATYHQDLAGSGVRGLLFSAYMRWVLPSQLRRTAAVVVPTLDYAQQSLVAPSLAQVTVVEIPHGIDTSFFSPGAPSHDLGWPWTPSEPTFLFVGALDRAHDFKRLPWLLRALRLEDLRAARLVVVGDGALRSTYEEEATAMGLKGRVHFAGTLSSTALREHYRATVGTVLPSTGGEIFGMVLVEAMACGRPVVATAQPGVRTVVEDGATGFLVPASDLGALAAAMKKLLDPRVAHEMGGRARLRATERFDRRKTGAALHALYERVLAGARRPDSPAMNPSTPGVRDAKGP